VGDAPTEKVLVRQPHPTWFAEVDEKNTYIYANFHDRNRIRS